MSKSQRTSYSIQHQVESFLTGAQLQFDNVGEHIFCSHGSTINKVSIEDGQVKTQISNKNEDDAVIRFIVSPSNELIVIAYHSGLITKYNLSLELVEREFRSIHTAPIACLKINSANTFLATGSSDGTVKLWNLKSHYCSHNLKGINGVISCIEFNENADEEYLLCSGGDDNIHIFDIQTSKRLMKLCKHCSTITDMKFTNEGYTLISVGRDQIAVLWNLSKESPELFGSVVRTIPLFESVESLVILESRIFSEYLKLSSEDEDGILFATLGESGVIKIWDTKSGSKVFTQNELPLSQDRAPSSQCLQLCLRPNYKQLCALSTERDIFLYELPNLKLTQQLQGHIDEILSACWFANDNYLAIACNSNDLKVIEVKTSKTQHLQGHSDIVLCVKAVSCDEMCIISSSKDCNILIWKFDPDTMTPSIVYKAIGHTHAIYGLAVMVDEKVFFSGGDDTTLKRWTFIVNEKNKHKKSNENLMKETKSLIADKTIKAHDERIDDIAISPDNQLVATASRDKMAKIFNASNLQLVATLRGHRRGIHAIQFSPVDQVVVTAGDSTLRMWNLQDFTCAKTFQGHDCSVLSFTFLADGLQLISVASDGNMKIWNCKNNNCIKTIDAHNGNIWALAKTDDDNLLVTGGQDEKLIIWRDTTKEEQEERINTMQSKMMQEQDFLNYINRKKWRKALKMAITMENQSKTLNVMREILLDENGADKLEKILLQCPPEQINFLIECCVGWNASAKSSAVAQLVLNIIIRNIDPQQLSRMPSFIESLSQLRNLTEKSFNRYERLVQQATFIDFFLHSFRIQ